MKDISKEQIFFLVVLVIVGYLSYARITGGYESLPIRSARSMAPAPEPVVPLPLDIDPTQAFFDGAARDLFAPPREWIPLDPVDLKLPPLEAPAMVPPMTSPAADVPHWGCYRARGEPVLVGVGAATESDSEEEAGSVAGDVAAGDEPPVVTATEAAAGEAEGTDGSAVLEQTAAEREAELKKQWDWLLAKGSLAPQFGMIVNEDKWGLEDRPDEDLHWRMLTSKGTLSRPNLLRRDRVERFGFAATLVNHFHEQRRDLRRSGSSLARRLDFVHTWLIGIGAADPRSTGRQAAGEALGEFGQIDPSDAREIARLLAAECEAIISEAGGSAAGQALGSELGRTHAMLGALRRADYDREGEGQAYRSGIEAGLEDAYLYRSWGGYLASYGLTLDAEDALRHAVEIDRNDPASQLALAGFLLEHGRGREALDLLTGTLKRDVAPELKADVLLTGARAALFEGRLDEAEQLAQRAANVTVTPAAEQLLVAGAIAFARQRYDEAVSRLEEALTLAETPDAEIHYSLGVALARLGRASEARAQLERASFLDPLGADGPQRALAYLDEMSGNDVGALEKYQAAVDMDPEDPYGLYLLGHSTRRNGDLEGSRGLLRQSLALEGRSTETLRELGFVSLELGAPEDALYYLGEARLAAPDDAEIAYMIGLAHAASGQIQDGVKAFSRGRVLRDDWAAPLNGLAYCYYRSGRVRETQERLAEAARLTEPSNRVHAEWAARARAALAANLAREQWIDHFAWRDLANEWRVDERYGATLKALGAGVELTGTVRADQPVRTALWRRADAKRLVSFEAELGPGAGNESRYGISLLIEKASADRMEPRAEIALARGPGSGLSVFVRESESRVARRWERLDLGGEEIDPQQTVLLRIQRVGDAKDFRYVLQVNDKTIDEEIEMRAAKGRSPEFKLSIFADAEPGQRVNIKASMSRVVRLRAES